MADDKVIRKTMFELLGHPDLDEMFWPSGELNCTELAEQACAELDAYVGDNADIPERFFEIAHEISKGPWESLRATVRKDDA